MLSVIIPTLNEEQYLPRLLASLQKQTYKDFEVIIADSNSQDQTVARAQDFGVNVVVGKKITNPAMARNLGASVAKGSLYLFLDADVYLEPTFIEKFMQQFIQNGLSVALPSTKSMHISLKNSLLIFTTNITGWFSQYFLPIGCGYCILVSKEIFECVGKFNEELLLGEDTEFIRKCAKASKYKFVTKPAIHISFRRHEQEGYAHVYLKHVFSTLNQVFHKGFTDNTVVEYKFGHYHKDDAPCEKFGIVKEKSTKHFI